MRKMICPFCSHEIPAEMEAEIVSIDSCCPSECDGVAKVSAFCPECGKKFWTKILDISYDVRRLKSLVKYDDEILSPDNVDFIEQPGGYLILDDGVLFSARVSKDVALETLQKSDLIDIANVCSVLGPQVYDAALHEIKQRELDYDVNGLLQVIYAIKDPRRNILIKKLVDMAGDNIQLAENYRSLEIEENEEL